jgi:hypothetical protein
MAGETNHDQTDNEAETESCPHDCGPLPCRGCTRGCGRYGDCDGKSWRLQDLG